MKNETAIWKGLIILNTLFNTLILIIHFGFLPSPITEKVKEWTNFTIQNPIQELDSKVNNLEKSIKESNLFWGTEYHNLAKKDEINNLKENLNNKLDISIFDQYQTSSRNNFSSIMNSIEKLQSNTNLSNEIRYWQNMYNKEPYYCYSQYHVDTSKCIELRNKIHNLQQKLIN